MFEIDDITLYTALFWNAFIAATLLPALSELALAALLNTGNGEPLFLFLSATVGNILGSVVNWWLGRKLNHYSDRKWFPFKKVQIEKAEHHFEAYGKWSLLFAWVPVVGDPLTFIAGVLRTPLLSFLLLVSIGKAVRYGVIVIAFTLV